MEIFLYRLDLVSYQTQAEQVKPGTAGLDITPVRGI